MKGRTVIVIVLLLAVIVGVFCYTRLEIVPVTRWIDPSRRAQDDVFLGLKRALGVLGIPWREAVRRPRRFGEESADAAALAASAEQSVFIQGSAFNWEQAGPLIIPWVERGGALFIAVDTDDWDLEQLLESLGVEYYDGVVSLQPEETEAENEQPVEQKDSGVTFERWSAFRITEQKADRISVIWHLGTIKLVTLYRGKGSVTLSGRPFFLYSHNLQIEKNAALASDLLIAPARKSGLLFFVDRGEDDHFFGSLAERGDIRPLGVSLLLLIVLGFWMTLPRFGRYRPLPPPPGRPLAERFRAEGRFFEKYGALKHYALIYRQEYELMCKRRGVESEAVPVPPQCDRKAFTRYRDSILAKMRE
ncbi:MAG: hypothetical protein LBN92_04290 [Treponema sp.]|jgi:hypothetical protein|nr:hypothetical protein [Treponema sp.]